MKEKKKLKYIILILIILILLALNLLVFINNYKTNEENTKNIVNNQTMQDNQINTIYNTVSQEEDEENRLDKIASLTESQRMQTYFGQYISYIENKDYESAYNLLYDGFKETYFKTLNEFESYAKSHYPSNIVVEYIDVERQGTLFILTVKVKDALASIDQDGVQEQQVVIMENSTNNFKLSFAVQE